MNNPSNAAAVLKALIIYAICVPVAVFVGYLLTNPMDYSTLGIFGVIALLLVSPLLLRWHYPLLVLCLQLGICVFFIKGEPGLGLVMTALSLGISVIERTLNRTRHFIRVPEITWPLICLAGVVLFTAKLTGGIGLHALGSSVYGGLKYVYLGLGIAVYFALSARRIPPERARLYVTLYFAGAMLSFIGDLYPIAPRWMAPVFWFFRPTGDMINASSVGFGVTRLSGFSSTGYALCSVLLALYGVRGGLITAKTWRPIFLSLSIAMIFLGGYRGQFFTIGLIFAIMFFMEGLHRSRLMPLFIFLGVFGFAILIPTASRLPFTFQRTLAILPLHLDSDARESAQATWEWRIAMWSALLPQVSSHLLLGKGLAISPELFQSSMGADAPLAESSKFDPSQGGSALAYDYHNGPLSILIPFGIWGALAFTWLMVVSIRVLYDNYRYGDPEVRTINLFFFSSFIAMLMAFLFIGGGLPTDLGRFTAILGLSIALNGGRCRPAEQTVPQAIATRPQSRISRLRPAFPR